MLESLRSVTGTRGRDGQPLSGMFPSGHAKPERRLARAIFMQAVHDIEVLPPTHQFHRDAIAWVRSEETNWATAFDRVCESLGLDTDAARTAILGRQRPWGVR